MRSVNARTANAALVAFDGLLLAVGASFLVRLAPHELDPNDPGLTPRFRAVFFVGAQLWLAVLVLT
jgi:hypothetical protein